MGYTHKRSTFGKKLIQHDVIRNQLAHAARKVESGHAWAESLIYQCENMSKEEANIRLGGETALLKAHAALVMKESSELCLHAFGGPGYTRGEGAGGKVERVIRDVNGFVVPGGSEVSGRVDNCPVMLLTMSRRSCWTSVSVKQCESLRAWVRICRRCWICVHSRGHVVLSMEDHRGKASAGSIAARKVW